MEDKTAQPTRVEVVKVIQLSAQQFQHFSANLLRDMPFITANKGLSGYDKGVTRCLLVISPKARTGILVGSDSDCIQYASYVPDISKLELEQVPVEQYRKSRARPGR